VRELLLQSTLGERHGIEVRNMLETLELSSSLQIFSSSVNFSFDSKTIRLQGRAI